MSARAALLLLLGIGAAACARRDAPYRFRAPLLTAVRAPELRTARRTTPPPSPRSYELRSRSAPPARRASEPPRTSAPVLTDGLGGALRARVGERHEQTPLAFALAVAADLGPGLSPEVRSVETGAALWSLAEKRGAVGDATPLTGDLVVFDAVDDDEPASLVAVVIATDPRAAVELLYLARGIVRRGWVTPSRPDEQRDQRGRILNTFVRAGRPADPLDTRYLAGQLYRGYLRLDAL